MSTPVALFHWSQAVADELAALFSSPEKFVALLLVVVIGTVAATVLIWLGGRAWHFANRNINRLLLRLGTVKALRRLVIGAYLRRVREVHGTVTNIYLEREDPLDLRQVFVPLTLRGRDDNGQRDRAPRDPRAVLTDPEHRRLLILGAPGSGKTTLMKALASGISQRQWPELAEAVPVYLRLRAYADAGADTDLWDWLAARLEADFGLRHAGNLLAALARDGQLLLLLDGLDEIGEAAVHWLPARIAALAERFAAGPPAGQGTRLIVTCREQNFDLLPDRGLFPRQGFATFRLAEMRDAEVEAMVARRAPDFAAKDKSTSAFLARVRAAPAIAELHRNPLLLTLSMGLYLNRAEDRVPHDLAEFYDQGIENLLRRHDFATSAERRLRLQPRNTKPYRDKLALLQRFALQTLTRATAARRDFEVWPVAELIEAARELAGERLGIGADEAEALVTEIHRNAGLISDTGDGEHFCFAHRSLHEFCAARALARRGDPGLALALANIDEPDWTQVLIFCASLEHDGAERLVETLLEQGRPGRIPRLALAGQCAAVLTRPLSGLRERVAEALSAALAGEGDRGAIRALLGALIRLGRDAAPPVRARVEQTLRRQLATDDPERLATELGRLDRPTALAILELLIDGGEPDQVGDRLRAALAGLEGMDGVERVPLLWRLIGLLAERAAQDPDQRNDLPRAAALLAAILDDPAAGERLEAQPALLADRFAPTAPRAVYPFTPADETPGNLAWLLALLDELEPRPRYATSAARICSYEQCTGWKGLRYCALETKDARQRRDWQRLSQARDRAVWRLPWRGLARVVVLSALVVGEWLGVLWGWSDWHALLDWQSGLPATLLVIGLSAGFVTALLWWAWDWLARHPGWRSARAGAVPQVLRTLLRPPRSENTAANSGRWIRSLGGAIGRFIGRMVLWSTTVVLMPLAGVLTAWLIGSSGYEAPAS